MSLELTTNPTTTGYEDIDKLNKAQSDLSNQMYQNQQNIINTQTEQNIAEIERNKQKLEEETTKTNKGLYADYQKQVNPYGATAESLATNGLGNSGVAETTKTNLYNTYQRNRTDTLNTAKNLLADYNNQITQARQNGDIQLAQFAQEMYTQRMNNLYTNYQLMQNKEQFNYQKERDQISDKQWQQQFDTSKSQWQQEFDYNKAVDDRNYNYQLERDNIDDNRWEREYNSSISKASSSGRSSSGSGSSSNSNNGNSLNISNDTGYRENIVNELTTQLGNLRGQVSEENYYNTIANSLASNVANGKLTQEEAQEIMNRL